MMCPPSTCCPSWWRRLPLPRQGPDHPQHGLGDGAALAGASHISTDRDYTQSALTLSWSLLDFGQSYYAARQNADRVRIAAERRRKAIYTLVQDVRTAYWRVVASQALAALGP